MAPACCYSVPRMVTFLLYLGASCLFVTAIGCEFRPAPYPPSKSLSATSTSTCKKICENYTSCIAAVFREHSKTCDLYLSIKTDLKAYVKIFSTCVDPIHKCRLKETIWKKDSGRKVAASSLDDCEEKCAADQTCVAVTNTSGCVLFSADAAIDTAPGKDGVFLVWKCTTETWFIVVIVVAAVVVVAVLALLGICCVVRRANQFDDDFSKIEPPPTAFKESRELQNLAKKMQKVVVPEKLTALMELFASPTAVQHQRSTGASLSRRLRNSMEGSLQAFADAISRSFFYRDQSPMMVTEALYIGSLNEGIPMRKSENYAEYEAFFLLVLENLKFNCENLEFSDSLGFVKTYPGTESGWKQFIDSGGCLSSSRLKKHLYRCLIDGYIPYCVGSNIVQTSYIVEPSDRAAVTLIEERTTSSQRDMIYKQEPKSIGLHEVESISGPDIIQIDVILAFHCEGWPYVANEWLNRSRASGWPDLQLVEEVVRTGVHLIPKSPNVNDTVSFCLSFAAAEGILANSLSVNKKQIFASAKAVLADIIFNRVERPTIPYTYCLKHIFFKECEDTIPSHWCRRNRMPERLLTILGRFEDCLLQKATCSHYFISGIDILSGSDAQERQIVANSINAYRQDCDLIVGALNAAEHRNTSCFQKISAMSAASRLNKSKDNVLADIRRVGFLGPRGMQTSCEHTRETHDASQPLLGKEHLNV